MTQNIDSLSSNSQLIHELYYDPKELKQNQSMFMDTDKPITFVVRTIAQSHFTFYIEDSDYLCQSSARQMIKKLNFVPVFRARINQDISFTVIPYALTHLPSINSSTDSKLLSDDVVSEQIKQIATPISFDVEYYAQNLHYPLYDFHFPDDPVKKALDLGCGTGRYTKFLVTKGYQVTAVDIYTNDLQIFLKKYPGLKSKITVEQKDITLYSSLKDYYSIITCNRVLPYLKPQNWKKILKNVYDALIPGGYFFGNFISANGSDGIEELKENGVYGPTDSNLIFSILKSQGFEFEYYQIMPNDDENPTALLIEFVVKKPKR